MQLNYLNKVALFAFVFVFPLNVHAQESKAPASHAVDSRPLKKELQAFAPFEGTWVFDGQWNGGGKLWAKNVYTIGMNGNFFEAKTYSKNEHGKEYQRYLTIWRFNKEKKKVESYGFTYDGSVTITESEVDNSDPKHPLIRSSWRSAPDQPLIKQEVQLIDKTQYSWKVWSSSDGNKWTEMMDGKWKKVSNDQTSTR